MKGYNNDWDDACHQCGQVSCGCAAMARLAAAKSSTNHEKAFLLLTDSLELALKGDTLRGLPNLGTHATPLWGLNLRGPQLDFKIPFPNQADDDTGSLQLVLHESGVPFWMFSIRGIKRAWFSFGRERVIAGDAGLQPRNHEGKVCQVADRANVITSADLQRLITCLPPTIDVHLEILREEALLSHDAEVLAKRITDKLKGDK